MSLPPGTTFEIPLRGFKKYVARIPDAQTGRVVRVGFGDRRYEHYKDAVPVSLGGGRWAHRDHLDLHRRKLYRGRAAGQRCGPRRCVDIPYSPAWFSYHYLW